MLYPEVRLKGIGQAVVFQGEPPAVRTRLPPEIRQRRVVLNQHPVVPGPGVPSPVHPVLKPVPEVKKAEVDGIKITLPEQAGKFRLRPLLEQLVGIDSQDPLRLQRRGVVPQLCPQERFVPLKKPFRSPVIDHRIKGAADFSAVVRRTVIQDHNPFRDVFQVAEHLLQVAPGFIVQGHHCGQLNHLIHSRSMSL